MKGTRQDAIATHRRERFQIQTHLDTLCQGGDERRRKRERQRERKREKEGEIERGDREWEKAIGFTSAEMDSVFQGHFPFLQ